MIIAILKSLIYMLAFLIIMRLAGYVFQLIYFLFFNKDKNYKKNEHYPENEVAVKMLQCEKCKTYISKSDAYTSNGKNFCKKEHSE
ncbi:MAG TPA: PP0621 family protein [Candidatus Azoamicus sp. MARI]